MRIARFPDQIERLVVGDVIARAANVRKTARFPERGSDVLDDEPSYGLGFLAAKAIDAVVAGLEIVIVQQQVYRDQSLQRPRAGEGILEPGPFPVSVMIGLEAESRRLAF